MRLPPLPASSLTATNEAHYIKSRPLALTYGGLPVVTNRTVMVITNIGYISGYDLARHNPNYVFYRLDPIGSPGSRASIAERPRTFTVGERGEIGLPSNPLRNTGYDHGHLAPNYAIASRFGAEAQQETFRVWNMLPQLPEHNRKTWRYLEAYEADDVANRYRLWVCDGPVFGAERKTAKRWDGSETTIEIPEQFYKIWLKEEDGRIKACAFLIPHDTRATTNMARFLTTVRKVESLTGINFFPELSDDLEERMENELPEGIW